MRPFNELEWIMIFFNNSIELNIEGIDRVRNFVFLWNLFETFACQKEANIPAISQAVEDLNQREAIRAEDFADFVNYFSNRYFNPNDNTYSINGLKFRGGNNDQMAKNLVTAVLTQNETQPKEILKALLYILYRFRNNLFHGEKQLVTIDSQINNFIAANNILAIVLDKMKLNFMTMKGN